MAHCPVGDQATVFLYVLRPQSTYKWEREREMFYLTTHSTHFIYGYIASDIWLRTILIVRKETRCRHIGYSYQLTARVLLYAPSHRQDSTYHGFVTPVVEHWLPVNSKINKISTNLLLIWSQTPCIRFNSELYNTLRIQQMLTEIFPWAYSVSNKPIL